MLLTDTTEFPLTATFFSVSFHISSGRYLSFPQLCFSLSLFVSPQLEKEIVATLTETAKIDFCTET
jgi:hypothetical protein